MWFESRVHKRQLLHPSASCCYSTIKELGAQGRRALERLGSGGGLDLGAAPARGECGPIAQAGRPRQREGSAGLQRRWHAALTRGERGPTVQAARGTSQRVARVGSVELASGSTLQCREVRGRTAYAN
jgi:hypothetical protein